MAAVFNLFNSPNSVKLLRWKRCWLAGGSLLRAASFFCVRSRVNILPKNENFKKMSASPSRSERLRENRDRRSFVFKRRAVAFGTWFYEDGRAGVCGPLDL